MNSLRMQMILLFTVVIITIAAEDVFYGDESDENYGWDIGDSDVIDGDFDIEKEIPISAAHDLARRLMKRWTYNCDNDICISRCQNLLKAKSGFCADNGKCHCIGKPKKNKKVKKVEKRSFLEDEDDYIY